MAGILRLESIAKFPVTAIYAGRDGQRGRTERVKQCGLACETFALPPDWFHQLIQSRSALKQAEH